MKLATLLLPLLLACSLIGCATTTKDIKVDVETDPATDLSAYKTYAWLASAQIINDPHGNWEPPGFDADSELRFLINRELRKHGKQQVRSRPDIYVAFAAGINMDSFEIVMKPGSEMYTLKEHPRGALLVVMIDPETRHPIWAGRAVGDVKSGLTSEQVAQRLSYVVKTMFEQLR